MALADRPVFVPPAMLVAVDPTATAVKSSPLFTPAPLTRSVMVFNPLSCVVRIVAAPTSIESTARGPRRCKKFVRAQFHFGEKKRRRKSVKKPNSRPGRRKR